MPQSRHTYQTMADNRDSGLPVYIGESPAFNEKKIRSQFVAKVYTILSIQLLATMVLLALCTFVDPIKSHLLQHGYIYSLCGSALSLIIYIILICVESARRNYPMNMILLAILTTGFAMMACSLAVYFELDEVLLAIGATAAATVTVMLIAKYSPFDITTCGCALCILSLAHLVLTIVLIVVLIPFHYSTANIIISGTGALLVSLYLMFDLQLIMGGRSGELSPEEYILAAVLLYTDIITLFQYLLMLIGNRR